MKNQIMTGCVMIIALCSAPLMGAEPSSQIIKIEKLNQQEIESFSEGKLGDRILECSQGAYLPLKMTLRGEFLALESEHAAPLYLKILKTCYIRCEEKENFLFSTDLQHWKRFSEFFTGRVGVSVNADNDGVIAELEIELDQRKPS
jgi:hypothetical protein